MDSHWENLYEVPLGNGNKQVRVTKFWSFDNSNVFVDIRVYKDSKTPSPIGICLKPEEFKWILSRLERQKRHGAKTLGRRCVRIEKPEGAAIRLKVTNAFKKRSIMLLRPELDDLVTKGKEISQFLKSIQDRIADEKTEEDIQSENEEELLIDDSIDEVD